jgi:CheY-like chemotaxis protein
VIRCPEDATSGDNVQARGQRVRVVEHDAEVRTLVVSLLSELGYRFRDAADCRSAL